MISTTATKSSTAPPSTPGGRTPSLLQTTSAAEDPRAARLALASWLAKLGGSELTEPIAARLSDAILTHFDLVPRGLGAVIRDAAREMYAAPEPSPAELSTLGPAVLLAIHEAYAPELSRPTLAALTEEYLAAKR